MAVMVVYGILVAALLFVLKVDCYPTTSTTLPTDIILDSPHHHGPSPEHNSHKHHGESNNMLDKDESHLTPVVQSFNGCVSGCMHPNHAPHAVPAEGNNGRHDAVVHKHSSNTQTHQDVSGDNVWDDEDADDTLVHIGHLLRDGDHHGSPNGHQNPGDGHPGATGGQLDDSINQYWMCSHACLLTAGTFVVG
ncbi:uncharacterized protein LOC117314898 isoform X2 [Pecten maximus]|uniref:uncharacterized protein LOC117314898 isoform X2 n=1 Tax=Pecten maximus TaxID=6579 RepID=UPI00145884CB|nr:uncharacterized protein LOC117314898 isoform X2 [Pecten maximus]